MSSIPVHIGRWQDHSRSRILGDTVTLDIRWSSYLIAALSTFVGLVGAALWSIIALSIHQCRARPDNNDAMFYQQQIIYRNQSSPVGAFVDLVKVCWAWRAKKPAGKRVSRLKTRSFLLSVPALLVFVAFTAAGIFISEVAGSTYQSNNVLVKDQRCGYWNFDTDTYDGLTDNELKQVNDTLAARQYARNCYNSNPGSAQCALFSVQSLPYNSSFVRCPFGDDPSGRDSCMFGQNQALQMDTGLLDTNSHLGINAAAANRVLLRNRVTCSPLRVHDYIKVPRMDGGYPIQDFWMGEVDEVTPYTYEHDANILTESVGYTILPLVAIDGDRVWHPVPALDVPNTDISVYFLASNSVQYLRKVTDPWFLATKFVVESVPGITVEFYNPNEYVSVMGCIDQYQICNPSTSPPNCTIMDSHSGVQAYFDQLGFNAHQLATARRLAIALKWTSTYTTVNALSEASLLAHDRLFTVISVGLPENQWQLEVQGWFQTSLAKLQAYIVEYATNSADLGPYGEVVTPNSNSSDPEERAAFQLCSNQRIRNTGAYQSFSFVALMIVVTVGVTIILLSWILEPLLSFFRTVSGNSGKRDYREIARIADRKLQLHRKALAGAGYGQGWQGIMDDVPITPWDYAFPAPSRTKLPGGDDYSYFSTTPLLTADSDSPNGPKVSSMSQTEKDTQDHLLRPQGPRAGSSQLPLLQAETPAEQGETS